MTALGRAVVVTGIAVALAVGNVVAEYVGRNPLAGFLIVTPMALAVVAAAIFRIGRPA